MITIKVKRKARGVPQLTIKQKVLNMVEEMKKQPGIFDGAEGGAGDDQDESKGFVIPAKAGIHCAAGLNAAEGGTGTVDPGLRRDDGSAVAGAPAQEGNHGDLEIRCSDSFAEVLANRNNPEFFAEKKKTMRDFADLEADMGSVKTWGPKVTLEEMVGKEVVIWGFRIAPSVKKEGTECLTMLLEITATSEKVVLFTGSTVLSKLCLRNDKTVPFKGKISKVKNYYAFE